ncbi:MAG: hypothetical protein ACJAU4_001097 [Glaciecola sp.]|jgi:hypothetical protein
MTYPSRLIQNYDRFTLKALKANENSYVCKLPKGAPFRNVATESRFLPKS